MFTFSGTWDNETSRGILQVDLPVEDSDHFNTTVYIDNKAYSASGSCHQFPGHKSYTLTLGVGKVVMSMAGSPIGGKLKGDIFIPIIAKLELRSNTKCIACLEQQPGQTAHMQSGGCLSNFD